MAKQTLSIFLIREGVPIDKIIEESKSPSPSSIKVGGLNCTVYSQPSFTRPPKWAPFFEQRVDTSLLQTASASALLVVPMKNRTFAVSFGHGRYLIDPLVVEPSFGLKATLNSVSVTGIRAIDKKAFEGISTHSREQASKDTSIGDFGLDVERDVVRAVSGTPGDSTLGSRLAGMDCLTATCDVTLDELPEYLQAYLAWSQREDYKERYPWVDYVFEIRDKALAQQLDERLLEILRDGGDPRTWLAIPDLIDWTDVDGFSYYPSGADRYPDLHLHDYLERAGGDLSADRLRQHRVFGWRATTDSHFAKWPVYKCIQSEIEVDGDTYLLSGGDWYRINNDFVDLVNSSVASIPQSTISMPTYGADENEKDYNERLAQSISGSCCLDRKLIHYGGGRSSLEFCDVYHPSGQMIHVKRYAGSSVLSHLFAQGTVSATAFLSDARFRHEVDKRLPAHAKFADPDQRPDPAAFEVAFMVASRSKAPLSLPFFSRVTLRNAYNQLSNYGLKTTLTKIQVVDGPS